MAVAGYPFDRVACPTATTGTGAVTVTAADPGYMTPYASGVRTGINVTLLITEGNDFELVEATAQNCSAGSCQFTRDTVRFASVAGVVSQAKLNLQGSARIAIVAGAADLNVHHGGTIDGDIVLDGNLDVAGNTTFTGAGGDWHTVTVKDNNSNGTALRLFNTNSGGASYSLIAGSPGWAYPGELVVWDDAVGDVLRISNAGGLTLGPGGINFPATSPAYIDGKLWFTGAELQIRVAGVTYNLSRTAAAGLMAFDMGSDINSTIGR